MLVVLVNEEFQQFPDELHGEVLYVVCGSIEELCEVDHSHLFHLAISTSICSHSE